MRFAGVIQILTVAATLAVGRAAAQQRSSSATDSSEALSLIHEAFRHVLQSGYSKASLQEQRALLQRALVLAQRGSTPTVEVEALYWISDYFRRQGAADSALAYGYRILRTARSDGDSLGEATGSFALAQIYADIGRGDSVLPFGLEAGKICRSVGQCWFRNQLIALLAPLFLGPDTLQRDSLLFLLRGYAALAQVQGDTVGLARLYDAIGRILTERSQRYDSALTYHRKTLQLKQVDLLTVYGLGRAFRGLGMPDSAVVYFLTLLNMARQVGDLRSEGYALGNLGGVCHRDFNPARLGCALAYYDSAASVASQVLREAGQDMNRVVYGEQASQIYSEWPFAWLGAADTIGTRSAILAALAVAELGRSEALRDLMGHLSTRERIPPLGIAAATLGQQVLDKLPVGTATLSYLVQADTVLAWLTLPTRDVRIYRWAIPYAELAERVSALRSSLGADDAVAGTRLRGLSLGARKAVTTDGQRLATAASRLANVLIPRDLPNLLPEGADLVLVPQNILNTVPFTILPLSNRTTLGARYAIRYAPSLIALIQVETAEAVAPHSRDAYTALVVSNPVMPFAEIDGVRMRLYGLPAADSEAAWVAGRLKGHWLSGSRATETDVVGEMKNADVIHLATHALAYAAYNRARDSFLALAPDSTHDGLLTVGTLMDDSSLSLRAHLIVLSGCQTALGSVTQGEGTVGLQRVLLAKGARALLVSLWSVDDEATEMLMKRFYSHWLEDAERPTKAEALRRTEQDVRRIPRFAFPLYWAPFQLVGAN